MSSRKHIEALATETNSPDSWRHLEHYYGVKHKDLSLTEVNRKINSISHLNQRTELKNLLKEGVKTLRAREEKAGAYYKVTYSKKTNRSYWRDAIGRFVKMAGG
jgi:hypothetical protein